MGPKVKKSTPSVGNRKAAAGKKKKQITKFSIDCKIPVDDCIMSISHAVDYLRARIKINGKTGQMEANGVFVESGRTKLTLTSQIPFSKRYLKYLIRKFLKFSRLRDWLRVVATSKTDYEMVYFQINQEEVRPGDWSTYIK